ncbi:methyl-accepting chemotaxis protein [Virgibacillus sp. 179-BFC.A HS]|uniref:Methyl-accepting chemotaxis protein n=1 Tax=Tigheibacillus jepli TaxID=3035914 RepID=A0ABU5CL35_9BACI|nr:methyl-accepting chemotaxis protein [Virgibacillus sp. 179-BFC.A HS]MDY0407074.1 methyl-accepting chemotaxis protein [Virgibacillus sp. 179-BFC.A HS]
MKKKGIHKSMSLKTRLIVSFLAVLLIPSIIIGTSAYISSKNKIDSQLTDTTAESVKLINQTVDQFIRAQMENIDYLSHAINAGKIKDNDNKQIRNLLDTIQDSKTDVEQTYVGSETGEFMNSPTSFKNPPDYDPRKRPWYQQAMQQKGEVIITDPYVSKSSNQVVVTLAKATEDEQGVVAVNLKLGNVGDMISKVSIGKKGYVSLIDNAGNYISDPSKEAGSAVDTKLFYKIKEKTAGQFDMGTGEKARKTAFTTSDISGWKTVGTMYQSEVKQATGPILKTTLIVIVISLLLSGTLILFIIRSILKPIHKLLTASREISKGNLSVPLVFSKNDELGQLAGAFNEMRKKLNDVILNVREKSTSLAASAEQLTASTEQNTLATEQISSSIQEVAAGVENQSASIERSSEDANEMSQVIQQIAASSEKVSNTTTSALSVVEEGNKALKVSVGQMDYIKSTVQKLSGNIEGLGKNSQEISKIVDVITDIADQTNLLALNAAIEAARAGEHGKGFAVVASEVRKLAEQSSASSEQIRQMIETIQDETNAAVQSMEHGTVEVDKGIEVVNNAGKSFEEISAYVTDISKQTEMVTTKMQEVASGIERFVETFDKVSEVANTTADGAQNVSASTQEQLASMEEIRGSAGVLTEMAEELQELVEQFKL